MNKSIETNKSSETETILQGGAREGSAAIAHLPRRARYANGGNAVRKATAAMLAATLCASMVPAAAFADAGDSDYDGAYKTEVVYVKTDGAGDQAGVYVVNQFQSDADAQVSDAGAYESVKSLTDDQALSAQGTSRFTVDAGETYLYQGNLAASTQTPWKVAVSYMLDGKAVQASELAGATGTLEMTLSLEPNEACEGDWADNYLLQVSAALDNDLAWDIDAADATVAQATGKTQLSYMVFPGKSATYTVRAEVRDFEFDGWQVVGVPLSIALDVDDDEFSDATDRFDELEDASRELNSGAQELASGAGSLADAAGSLRSGGMTLSQGFDALASGGSELESGVGQLQSGIGEKSAQLSAAAGQIDVDSARTAYAQAAQNYTATFAGAFTRAFNAAYQQYLAAGLPDEEASSRAQADAAQAAGQAAAGQYEALSQALGALVTAQATKTGYESAAGALGEVAPSVDALASGISSYVDATGQLAAGAKTMSAGTSALASGVSSLADGSDALAGGTSELEAQTDGIGQQVIDQVKDKLTDYLNPDFVLRDFVNGQVEGTKNVQFVYKTEAVEIPEEEVEEDDGADTRTIVQKFLALFGL